ncbi:B12-binding domain-containing radical SAM protein [Herbivorax sp. ANBcel31]|uniref:B12-binding domain-containing radical SAM protein n=1 Tax=Herbivorax sp. ANBcel31 TaxID=3069754 RepID=UPI0027B5B599|nr:B12-binding domain-containing radical SAM protein [Herbivorax sp. ANBcel31]MDQ2085686.1 B12-binding domain-containing radical SAM protein [Herbivorax sp. ANBcel31]
MKVLLTAINAKYIHSALAPWYLWASCKDYFDDIEVKEFSINENLEDILGNIYFKKCDVVAFSCYIWNIEHVLKTSANLKKIAPDIKIVLGGPEVSHNAEGILNNNKYIDYIISGEGEFSFRQLLQFFEHKNINIDDIKGIAYRKNKKVVSGEEPALIENLDDIPTVYTKEMIESVKDKIIYYESSRGCPFSCSYCISSTFKGVRYFSMDRVKKELKTLLDEEVKLVKFVDRTFNCNKKRVMEIFKFVIENSVNTCFHFEAAGDLFDSDMLELLSKAPEGIIQFEIGVQSTNEPTLQEIDRRTNTEKVFYYAKKLIDLGNIHVHLDLIAGLPYENYSSFKNSFDEVYNLKPHKLQLGFLKMLKGSEIRKNSESHHYLYREYPPYEVLQNKYLSFEEIFKLKKIEKLVDRYYNSGRFCKSVDYIIKNYFSSPFEFYEDLASFYEKEGYFNRSISSRELYTILLKFIDVLSIDKEIISELMKFDFLTSHKNTNIPEGIEKIHMPKLRGKVSEFLKNKENVNKYLPEYLGASVKKIIKNIHFEPFRLDVTNKFERKENLEIILFNYNKKSKVLGLFEFKKIDL